jgi:hypothetical protein
MRRVRRVRRDLTASNRRPCQARLKKSRLPEAAAALGRAAESAARVRPHNRTDLTRDRCAYQRLFPVASTILFSLFLIQPPSSRLALLLLPAGYLVVG